MPEPNAGGGGGGGRIAIKFGAPSATAKPSRNNPPSTLGKRTRPGASAWGRGSDSEHDSDDDDDHGGSGRRRGKHEVITGFGADGAETERSKREAAEARREYVIERQPNRDWRTEMKAQRKGKNLLPEEARAQQEGAQDVERAPADQDSGIKWGLTVKKKGQLEDDGLAADAEAPSEEKTAVNKDNGQNPPPAADRSADAEAMDALLGNAPEKDLAVIPAATEDEAYRRDASAAGAASTLADYDAMPVEEFGAALLRGMGWDGKDRGPKTKDVKRRPNRLGLGAKELKEAEDLGGWNRKGKGGAGGGAKRPRLNEYRREESKRKEERGREDSYKRERERERDRDRDRDRHRDRDRDRDRDYERRRDGGHRDRDGHRRR